MNLPLQRGARLRILLHEAQNAASVLCGIARTPGSLTALEWTERSLATGEDAGANLAVRQAPLAPGVHVVGKRSLDGLPGFLADSLPDSWGRQLVDRQCRRLGLAPAALSGLDRLAIVGRRGTGALLFEPEAPLSDEAEPSLDLDSLARDSTLMLRGGDPELLTTLERAGGSAGGSRPKAWIAEDRAGRLRSGAQSLRDDETGWLVKFRAPGHDPQDIAALEYAYARMAQAAGIRVAQPRLLETSAGRYFASQRFDREGPQRLHVLTAAGLLDVAPHQAMAADYADLLKLTRYVTRSEEQVLQAYRHAVFNVLCHNRDDHLKQFAFLRKDGVWRRSPAYDLTYSPGPGGEHTLLVAGEGADPGREDLRRLAELAGLKHTPARRALEEVFEAVRSWSEHAAEADVGADSRARVGEAIRRHSRR